MATLYVEKVPEDLYGALRKSARLHRKSIAAEVLSILEQNIATPAELKERKKLFRQAQRLRSQSPLSRVPFRSTEELQREDRSR